MESIIKHTLSEIEREHGIRLLYACESGSRAWGFPSPDSDYDIRFIYCRPLEDYLSIRAFKDSITDMPKKVYCRKHPIWMLLKKYWWK